MYLSQGKDSRIAAVTTAAASTPSDLVSWIPATLPLSVDPLILGIKRPSPQVLYHQTILGAHSTIEQTDAWYSTNFLAKRPRFMSASNLPTYPQRPGEKDCAHYMLTRTCKFGDSCKFDHPIWVPEGGIPNWKEVPLVVTSEILPDRPGVPDCPYFLKTERCKYGMKCKFNHPKNAFTSGASKSTDPSALPERPSEPMCSFYMKTGKCKFGATCKFHHPKNVPFTSTGEENGDVESDGVAGTVGEKNYSAISVTPALFQNSKGLPIRLYLQRRQKFLQSWVAAQESMGEVDCPFYLKTGSCKYGVTCRYNHPDRNAFIPPAANLNVGAGNPSVSLCQTIDPRFAQPLLGIGVIAYPQRPGQTECDYYMKTGECKFGERCKFHHPIEWSGLTSNGDQAVNITLSGLPRRKGAVQCPYYMKTGMCKFGATCKFDHPPLEETVTAEAEAKAEAGT